MIEDLTAGRALKSSHPPRSDLAPNPLSPTVTHSRPQPTAHRLALPTAALRCSLSLSRPALPCLHSGAPTSTHAPPLVANSLRPHHHRRCPHLYNRASVTPLSALHTLRHALLRLKSRVASSAPTRARRSRFSRPPRPPPPPTPTLARRAYFQRHFLSARFPS